MKKIGRVLFCFLPFLITLGMQILISIPVLFYYSVFKASTLNDIGDFHNFVENLLKSILNPDFSILVTVLWVVSSSVLFAFWYNKKRDQSNVIPLKKLFHPMTVTGIILMVFGLQVFISYFYSGIELIHPEWFSSYEALMESMSGGSTIGTVIMMVYAVIGAPIHEELVFRGVTLHYAKKALPFWAANFLQALLFGIMHLNLVQGFYAFLAGLFMGYVCHKTGSLWAAILFHFIFNLIGSFAIFQNIGSSLAPLVLICMVGVFATLMGVVLYNAGTLSNKK